MPRSNSTILFCAQEAEMGTWPDFARNGSKSSLSKRNFSRKSRANIFKNYGFTEMVFQGASAVTRGARLAGDRSHVLSVLNCLPGLGANSIRLFTLKPNSAGLFAPRPNSTRLFCAQEAEMGTWPDLARNGSKS